MTGPFDDTTLEAGLLDLGLALDVPPAPDVARAVGARLRLERSARRPALRLRWALIAALIALVALAAIAAGRGFGLPGLRIFFETPAPTASPPPTPSPPPSTARPSPAPTALPSAPPAPGPTLTGLTGRPTSVADARREVEFEVRLPDRVLVGGPPSSVYLDRQVPGGEVILIWTVADVPATANLPLGPEGTGRVAFVMTQTRGRIEEGLLGKLLGPGNTITPLDLGRGVSGIWIEGPVHRLLVYDATGNVRETATRDVGNVLAWVRNGVLYRIETNLDLERTLPVARSVP
jgi:hypothetical protein